MKESGEKVLPSIYLDDIYRNLKDFGMMLKNYEKYTPDDFENLKNTYLTLMRTDINRLNGIINENPNANQNPVLRLCKILLHKLESQLEDLDSYEILLSNKLNKIIPDFRRSLRKLSNIFSNL